jgi:hypothetical protein
LQLITIAYILKHLNPPFQIITIDVAHAEMNPKKNGSEIHTAI